MDGCCASSEDKKVMGSVEWGRRKGAFSKGRLTRFEKVKLLMNMGRMTVLEAFDAVREKSGLINAYGADLDGLQPPDTRLVRDAFDLADDVQGLELMRHSWRTYYWAMLLGGYRRLDIDREILFAAAILHDLGLARDRTSEPRQCCFVVHGAERCKAHLVGKGHDRARVRKIADAIGLHLNAYVSERIHGVEAHLLSRGAMCDVFDMGKKRLSGKVLRQVHAEHPKGDLVNGLEIWPGHHLRDTRADFLIGLGGKRKARPQPRLLTQPGE
ncbi:HD domain-containing protein [Roseibium sp.]|uniref:HD domain-containing protein n=1 Tax=Roseibium sp. TaxID=1936156 RepID=UPI0025EADF91|nr:HD domain-containing protein [Roseibium sp.]